MVGVSNAALMASMELFSDSPVLVADLDLLVAFLALVNPDF